MRITTTQLAERIARLEDIVASQQRAHTQHVARSAPNVEAIKVAMAAAREEAMRTGHSVKVQA